VNAPLEHVKSYPSDFRDVHLHLEHVDERAKTLLVSDSFGVAAS